MLRVKPIVFLIALVIILTEGNAQPDQKHIDSLVNKLELDKTYEDSIKSLRALAWYLIRHNLSMAEEYTRRFQNLAEQKQDSHTFAVGDHYLGLIKRFEGAYAESLSLFQFALDQYQKNAKYRSSELGVLFNIGVIYQQIGDYGNALDYLYREYKLGEELGIKKGRANTLNSIGNIFKKIKDYSKAIEVYDEAMELAKDERDRITESNILYNRADVKITLGDLAGAAKDCQASLAIDSNEGYLKGMASSYAQLARIHLQMDSYSQA